MKYTIILLLFTHLKCFSQVVWFKVDSLIVSYVPWSLHTTLALDEDQIRNFNSNIKHLKKNEPAGLSKYYQQKKIMDSTSIKEFCKLNLVNQDSINYKTELDVRMVIDIYIRKNKTSICIDHALFYKYSNHIYSRNSALIKWINAHVTPSN